MLQVKPRKTICALILLLSFVKLNAQTDTTYFDVHSKTCTKDKSLFYRTISPIDGSKLFLVSETFVVDGSPKMLAVCSSINPIQFNGKFTSYRANAKKASTGNYSNNKKVGVWYYWNTFGDDSTVIEHLPNGSQIAIYTPTSDNEIHYFAQQMPEFPGSPDALRKYIITHLELPEVDKKNVTKGTIVVMLTIDKTGKVIASKVIKSLTKTSDEAALKMVNAMPNWVPAKLDGKPVNIQFTIPVKIK